MALIDPSTGLPVTSRMQTQPASDTLLDIMADTEPFPPGLLDNLAGKAIHGLRVTKANCIAQGMDPDGAYNTAVRAPVTIDLGVLMGLLRDALVLQKLLSQPAQTVDLGLAPRPPAGDAE